MQQEESPNVGLSNLRKEDPGYLAIKRYGNNEFTLTNDETYQGAIVLYKDQIYTDLAPISFADLNKSFFRKWLSLKPEMVLIGTGDKHEFLNAEQQSYFYTKGIGIETMKTDSACRTYSIIAGEMRNVVVVLFTSEK